MKTPISTLSSTAIALCVSLLLIHAATALRLASAVPHLRSATPMLRRVDVNTMRRHLEDREGVAWVPSDFRTGKVTHLPVIHQHSSWAPSPSMRAIVPAPHDADSTNAMARMPSMFRVGSGSLLPTMRLSKVDAPIDWHLYNVSHHAVLAPHAATSP